LRKDGSFKVEERIITLDEVWIISSSKDVTPVTNLDGLEIGSGQLGMVQSCKLICTT